MDYVGVVDNLRDIYDKDFTERYDTIASRFFQEYSEYPDYFVRAPGRVNIIGEHIDYSGYPVLPMAIERDTVIAAKAHPEALVLRNTHKVKYPDSVLPLDAPLSQRHEWTDYIIAGCRAAHEVFPERPVGMQVLVDGTVPAGSGLSSSASITVAAALANLVARSGPKETVGDRHIVTAQVTRARFSEMVTEQERLVGTACGGMDQAISLLAQPGHASFIEFNPLRALPVTLPEDCSFIVANSLTPSVKSDTLATRYNKRVVECRFSVLLLCKALGIARASHLSDLQNQLGFSFAQMIEAVNEHLPKDEYLVADLEADLGAPLLSHLDGIAFADLVMDHNTSFKLKQRCLHIYGEAQRVLQFKESCEAGANPAVLGQLMNESHESCRELYECSSEQLDELVHFLRSHGALGARLTGAGWGGCTIALVENAHVVSLLTGLRQFFEAKAEVIEEGTYFATKPSSAACVLDPKYFAWREEESEEQLILVKKFKGK